MKYTSYYDSPLGKIMINSDGTHITGLWFMGSRFMEKSYEEKELPVFMQVKKWLDQYFEGKVMNPKTIPFVYTGSDFCVRVWEILLEIPYGKTITYGDIANKISQEKNIKRMSAQAVGYAVGHNPISILIPCHRVVGVKGNLTGYGGGIDKKIKLLEIEKVDMSDFYIPKKGNAL